MTYQVLEPTFDARRGRWSCCVVDLRTCAVVATTYGETLLEAECKAIGAAAIGNDCRVSREGRAVQ